MGTEIERKFLVCGDQWRLNAIGTLYRQGYIVNTPEKTVRVRIAGDRGYLTIKGATVDVSRAEFEYEIPVTDAAEMLETLCQGPLIEKTRHKILVGDLLWEVDEFSGDNVGLIMAEVELPAPDYPLELPDWVGEEVSHDVRYFNANLSHTPYTTWDR